MRRPHTHYDEREWCAFKARERRRCGRGKLGRRLRRLWQVWQ
jgi:hypothetical protein